jgi:hypothetical protein
MNSQRIPNEVFHFISSFHKYPTPSAAASHTIAQWLCLTPRLEFSVEIQVKSY